MDQMHTHRNIQRNRIIREKARAKNRWTMLLGAAAACCLIARLPDVLMPAAGEIAANSRRTAQKTAARKVVTESAAIPAVEDADELRSSDAWQDIFAQEDLYPAALIQDLERNPEMLDFVSGYLTAMPEATGGLTEAELQEDCPLLIQWDERWGYVPYGQSNIGISGCGPACLSMVLFSLTRDPGLTPDALAELAMDEGYYVSGSGTAWSFLTEVAPRYGVMPLQHDIWTEDMMKQYLEDGKLLILSMGPGYFTDEGHFIVVRGYEDGKLLINDPFSYANSSKAWEYSTIEDQCRQMWAYEASGGFPR